MNGNLSNKREKRDIKSPSKIQSDNSRAKIRKVGTGVGVSSKRANVAGRKSLVHITDLQARQDNSMANTKADYEEQGLEDKRDRAQLYSVRCYDCD